MMRYHATRRRHAHLVADGLFVQEHSRLLEGRFVAILCRQQLLDVSRKLRGSPRSLPQRAVRLILSLLLHCRALPLRLFLKQRGCALLKLVLRERGNTSALALEVEGVEISRKVGSELRAVGDLELARQAHD
jgi:hypothetical protein